MNHKLVLTKVETPCFVVSVCSKYFLDSDGCVWQIICNNKNFEFKKIEIEDKAIAISGCLSGNCNRLLVLTEDHSVWCMIESNGRNNIMGTRGVDFSERIEKISDVGKIAKMFCFDSSMYLIGLNGEVWVSDSLKVFHSLIKHSSVISIASTVRGRVFVLSNGHVFGTSEDETCLGLSGHHGSVTHPTQLQFLSNIEHCYPYKGTHCFFAIDYEGNLFVNNRKIDLEFPVVAATSNSRDIVFITKSGAIGSFTASYLYKDITMIEPETHKVKLIRPSKAKSARK